MNLVNMLEEYVGVNIKPVLDFNVWIRSPASGLQPPKFIKEKKYAFSKTSLA